MSIGDKIKVTQPGLLHGLIGTIREINHEHNKLSVKLDNILGCFVLEKTDCITYS